ncbi:MAG: heme o synthase [Zavarzinella sp.]
MNIPATLTQTMAPNITQRLAGRLTDYVQLCKPRIAVMVLVTVAAGYFMGAVGNFQWLPLLHVLLGTGLVAASANIWNQLLERTSDAQMRRTADRPLPAGRLSTNEVAMVGTISLVTGLNYLFYALPSVLPCLVAAATFLFYVAIYTPMKKFSTWNTVVGAIPGALPPVIGWTAARGNLDWAALCIFLVLFCWQLPHFMAIAWMYRDDYRRGGYRMLPVLDSTGQRTSRAMIGWCVLLIASSLLVLFFQPVDLLYLGISLVIGLWFLSSTLKFSHERTHSAAKQVLKVSIIYLPIQMGIMMLNAARFPW